MTEQQIVIAAEINTDSPDFGHLEPMVKAARRQLRKIGILNKPGEGGWYTWMRDLLATENRHRLYRKRQATVEPVFGQTVFNRKLTRFHRRGHAAVHSECG